MTASRISARWTVLGLLVLALGLSACGRKGPLDAPPGASAAGQQQTAAQPAGPGAIFGAPTPAEEAPAEVTQAPKRRIILDGLLN